MKISFIKVRKWLPAILMEMLLLALLSTIIMWDVISPLSLGLSRNAAKIAAIVCFFSLAIPFYFFTRNFNREKIHCAMFWSILGVFLFMLTIFMGGCFAGDIIFPASLEKRIIGTIVGALVTGPLFFFGAYFFILFGIPERRERME